MVLLVLVAAACGGPSAEDTSAPEPTAEAPTAAATDDEAAGDASEEPAATETASAEGPSALAGETIEFVIPYDPGGGYDQYVRLVAPYLADCLGAEVVPVNQPGAGSLLATNQTAVAEPDGTRIQILTGVGAIGAQLAGAEGVQFDLTEFSWLARVAGEPKVLSVGANSGFESVEDLKNAEEPVRFVAAGPGSSEYLGAIIMSEVFGIETEIVTGFSGSGESIAAIARGDVDAIVLSLDSSMGAIQAGDLVPLAVMSEERSDTIPDVPTIFEFEAADESQQAVLDAYVAMGEAARPVAGPPGIPEDVLTSLREGFECALGNEELIANAEEAGRPLAPLSGEEIEELVVSALDSPETFKELVRQSFEGSL